MKPNFTDVTTHFRQHLYHTGHPSFQSARKSTPGFTLVELLVGMVATSILISFAGSSLVTVLQIHNRVEAEVDQQVKLNRALDYISDDIREAKAVSTTAPPGWTVPANHTAILYLTKPDDSTVAFYSRASGSNWRGPLVIYRAMASNSTGTPLVDGVANTAPGCFGSGTAGLEVSPSPLTTMNRSVTLCLLGMLPNGTTDIVQSNVSLRSNL